MVLEDGYYVVDKPLPPVQISLCKLTIWASNNVTPKYLMYDL
jgi:hypothetical protein